LIHGSVVDFSIDEGFVNLDEDGDSDDFIDPTFQDEFELEEADRLISLVKGITLQPLTPAQEVVSSVSVEEEIEDTSPVKGPTTKITDEEAIRKAKRRRKKLLKQLKAIDKLKEMESAGKVLNQEQLDKVAKQEEWSIELESVEHNLM